MSKKGMSAHDRIVHDYRKTAGESAVVYDILLDIWKKSRYESSGTAYFDHVHNLVAAMKDKFSDRLGRLCRLDPNPVPENGGLVERSGMSDEEFIHRTSKLLRLGVMKAAEIVGGTTQVKRPER